MRLLVGTEAAHARLDRFAPIANPARNAACPSRLEDHERATFDAVLGQQSPSMELLESQGDRSRSCSGWLREYHLWAPGRPNLRLR